jgi:hypothetical protein
MTFLTRRIAVALAVFVLAGAGSLALAEVKFTTVGSGSDADERNRTVTERPADSPSVYGVVNRTASEARNQEAGTKYRSGRGARSAYESTASSERSGTVTQTASERRTASLPVTSARGYRTDRGRSLPRERYRTVTSRPD